MKPKVVLIGTGGTIASRYDAAQGRVVASASADDLVAMLPGAASVAELEVDDFATVHSFGMTLGFALDLTRRINATLARPDVAGAVVTQGTDTMEETCYLADLLLEGDKPAVFTGAQRKADEPDADGPRNLADAIRVAASPAARGLGAVLCFNGRIHAGRDVTKVHASAVDTFQTFEVGALGEIDGDAVIIHRRPALRRTFAIDQLEERVDLVRLSLGTDSRLIDAAVDSGAKGLVVEAFGRGNGPPWLTATLAQAIAAGVTVVVTSRCPAGRVLPVYGGGGGRDLEDAGVIFAGDLKGAKVRILLMVLLSHPASGNRVAEIFKEMAP
jgi:L-asparaginase